MRFSMKTDLKTYAMKHDKECHSKYEDFYIKMLQYDNYVQKHFMTHIGQLIIKDNANIWLKEQHIFIYVITAMRCIIILFQFDINWLD